MPNENVIRSTTLYSQKNGSDKVYTLQIDKVESGYLVIYANGRRGSTLKPKQKSPSPITLEEANKLFDKLVKEKTGVKKGYTESPDCVSTLINSENLCKNSGIEVQLLNSITEKQALELCMDSAWVAQEKHDGERRPVMVKNAKIEGLNRYGEYTGLVKDIADGINPDTDMVLDSEDLCTHLAAFDLLEYNGSNLRELGFLARHKILLKISEHSPSITVSPVAITQEEKSSLLQKMISENREGIVFKRSVAPYTAGKPNSGGDQLKFKLYDETSVIVSNINTKRSVQMSVLDNDGQEVIVGNVTIPANAAIPEVGSVIEVKYLYAYRNGSLYQPIFNKPRNDLKLIECRQSRLKYKPSKAA